MEMKSNCSKENIRATYENKELHIVILIAHNIFPLLFAFDTLKDFNHDYFNITNAVILTTTSYSNDEIL